MSPTVNTIVFNEEMVYTERIVLEHDYKYHQKIASKNTTPSLFYDNFNFPNTVKHQILNHKIHDPRNSRHHLIRGIFRSRREKNAPFTCNLICKTTLKSTQQIHGNTLISTNSKNAGIKMCREYDVLQYLTLG